MAGSDRLKEQLKKQGKVEDLLNPEATKAPKWKPSWELEHARKQYKANRGWKKPQHGSPGNPKYQPVPTTKKRMARKGDRVGYRSLGEVNPGTPPTGIVGAGPSVGAMPTPAVAQKRPPSVKKQPSQEDQKNKAEDALNKKAAKAAAAIRGQGQPQGKPSGPPGMPQPQKPPVLSRKGDAIKPQGYKRGGKVGKAYTNFCRPASNPDA